MVLLHPEIIERTGKNPEEIADAIAREYDVPVERVKIEVLEAARDAFLGFIGGSLARVRATVLPDPRDIAWAFVRDTVEVLNPEARLEVEEEGDRFIIHIEGIDVGNLIGKHGATLNALQYLASIVANRFEGTPKLDVEVDVSGYRDSRLKSLQELACRLADTVLDTGRAVELEPMNSAERKIIHLTLKAYEEIATWSVGDEPNRAVVIARRGDEGATPERAPERKRDDRRPRRGSRGGRGRSSRGDAPRAE